MGYPSAFHLISAIAKKTGAKFVLTGGFAVNYYKVTRQTVDTDFLITESDYQKIKGLLEKEGYRQGLLLNAFVAFRSDKPGLMDIDFLFVDEGTLGKIIKDGKRTEIAGEEFIVPSLNHLIALKLHAIKNNPKIRLTKDLPDIVNLIRINKVNFSGKEFKELCLKYGTKDIYERIIDSL